VIDGGQHRCADQNLSSSVAPAIGLAGAREQATSFVSQACEAFVK
jgi:hypothetical protein